MVPRETSRTASTAVAPEPAWADRTITLDENGAVTSIGAGAEALLGFLPGEAVGCRLADAVTPQARPRLLTTTPPDDERTVSELRAAQARLLAAQERQAAVTRHSTLVSILCGSLTEPSTFLAGSEVLGYEADAILPGGFLGLVHPDDHASASTFIGAVRAGHSDRDEARDLRVRAADGSFRVFETTAEDLSHVPAVSGVLIRGLDVTIDRARTRELEDRTVQMRTLIDNLGAAVLLEDHNRRVLVTNSAFAEMFRIPAAPDALVGADCANAAETVRDMFTDGDGFVASVTDAVTDFVPRLSERLELVDGGMLERDYLPILNGTRAAGHLWVYRDITRQIVETQLLADQNRSLEQLAALKNEFVARVSHELRTPLTSVVSFADMLADTSAGGLTDEQATFVDIILRNARRLLRLIEDLLLVAKLESHTLPLSLGLIDLPLLVEQVVTDLTPTAMERSIVITSSATAGPRVRGDSVRLQQVVSNLVGNAIAYTPPGGRVHVDTTADEPSRQWDIRVSDTGVGIESGDLGRVFEAFFRTGGSAGSTNGTGLGLAIVRLLVEEHAGTVSVQSTPGSGTTMSVHLPMERP